MSTEKESRTYNYELVEYPYSWLKLDGFISRDLGQRLSETYPQNDFTLNKRLSGGSKQYQFSVRNIVEKGGWKELEGISEEWIRFLRYVDSESFTREVEEMTGLELAECSKDIGFFRFDQGDWVSPHIDREYKRLTFVLYFNVEWHSSWGGCLHILKSKDSDSWVTESLPLIGNAAGIIKSANAWHAVTPVTGAAKSYRKTVQVEFWEKEQ